MNHGCATTFVNGVNPFLPPEADVPSPGELFPAAREAERKIVAALTKRSPDTVSGLAKKLKVSRALARAALTRMSVRPVPLVTIKRIDTVKNRPVHFYGLLS